MKRLLPLAGLAILFLPETSEAQPQQRGFGLGVETNLSGVGSPSGAFDFVYDMGQFRFDGLFGLSYFEATETVNFLFGARFNYVLHNADRADFSVGFGAGIGHVGRATRGEVDALAQVRAFITPNVSANASLGLAVGFGDGRVTLGLGGQLLAIFGFTYFFSAGSAL
jgi:hypothetical protein